MREKVFNFLYKAVNKYSLVFIILSVVLGVLFIFALKNIQLKSDYIDLLPPDSEPVVNLKNLSKTLRGVGQFSIVVISESENIKGMSGAAEELYQELNKLKEIQYINYKIPEDLKKSFFLFIDIEDLKEIYGRLYEKIQYELWKDAPFFINLEDSPVEFNIDDIIGKYKKNNSGSAFYESEYLISNDKKILIMFLKPDFLPTDIDKTGNLIKKINDKVKKIDLKKYGTDLKIYYGGSYVLTYDQKNAIYKDISFTSVLALIFIFITVLIFIRNFGYSVSLLYSLFVGVLSVFGLAFITLHHINLITGFLLAILTGMGVNYGIHFLFRYKEELNKGNLQNALNTSFTKTIAASFTGAITTAASFFTLIFSKFLGFSEFGFLASFGIMFTLLSTYIFTSSIIVLSNKIIKNKKVNEVNPVLKVNNISEDSKKYKKVLIVIFFVLIFITLISGIFIKNIQFEYDSKKLEVRDQQSIKITEMIQEKFNVSTDPSIFWTYDREEEKDFFNSIKKISKNKDSFIGNVMSISSIINDEEIQKEKIKVINKIRKEIKTLPENSFKDNAVKEQINIFLKYTGNLKIITENDIPENIKKRYVFEDQDKKIYISHVFPKKVLFDANDMRKYVDEIKVIKGEKKIYKLTGLHILYVYLIELVLSESRIFIIIVFIIIWLLLLLDFKSLKNSLIGMTPLIFGILWLLEIMAVFHVKFNFMNIIVLPTVLGTGVDNGVHIFHRYKENNNLFEALKKAGLANLSMSLTVALGWFSLFFAHYEGLKTMAFVGVTGILTTFVASLTIMPALILLFDKKS